MIDIKTLHRAIEQLAGEKEIDPAQVFEVVEASLASAYKKEFDKKGAVIRCLIDPKMGTMNFVQVKTVVDESMVRIKEFAEDEQAHSVGGVQPTEKADDQDEEEKLPYFNSEQHLWLDEAKTLKADAVVGDEISFKLETPSGDFGRIAAQTAKQVILQKIREIEKEAVRKEYESKVGELITGIVQRIERGNVFVDVGKTSGVLYFSEGIPGERYRIGERLRFYLLNVQEGGKGPMLVFSRSHPRFVVKLFELEVPEIGDGVVEVKVIAREAGGRTKIAVASSVEGVDPVGACVGQRGSRVMAVNGELGVEKIDVIAWDSDPEKFIAAALSPAQVTSVEAKVKKHEAMALVPDDQLSLAIGRNGQNVRLAAKLTGYKIDVRSQSRPDEVLEGGIATAVDKDEEDVDF